MHPTQAFLHLLQFLLWLSADARVHVPGRTPLASAIRIPQNRVLKRGCICLHPKHAWRQLLQCCGRFGRHFDRAVLIARLTVALALTLPLTRCRAALDA